MKEPVCNKHPLFRPVFVRTKGRSNDGKPRENQYKQYLHSAELILMLIVLGGIRLLGSILGFTGGHTKPAVRPKEKIVKGKRCRTSTLKGSQKCKLQSH